MSKIIDTLGIVKTAKFWKELVIMTLGMFVAAAAVYYFLVPSKLIIGSISGLSIVISNIFAAAGNVSEVYGLWSNHSKKKAIKTGGRKPVKGIS